MAEKTKRIRRVVSHTNQVGTSKSHPEEELRYFATEEDQDGNRASSSTKIVDAKGKQILQNTEAILQARVVVEYDDDVESTRELKDGKVPYKYVCRNPKFFLAESAEKAKERVDTFNNGESSSTTGNDNAKLEKTSRQTKATLEFFLTGKRNGEGEFTVRLVCGDQSVSDEIQIFFGTAENPLIAQIEDRGKILNILTNQNGIGHLQVDLKNVPNMHTHATVLYKGLRITKPLPTESKTIKTNSSKRIKISPEGNSELRASGTNYHSKDIQTFDEHKKLAKQKVRLFGTAKFTLIDMFSEGVISSSTQGIIKKAENIMLFEWITPENGIHSLGIKFTGERSNTMRLVHLETGETVHFNLTKV